MSRRALTKEEERSLFIKWRAGDEAAGNKIIEHFREWAISVALPMCGGIMDEELEAAALEGLADGMRRFDLKRGACFSIIAGMRIKHFMRQQICSRARAKDHLSFVGDVHGSVANGEADDGGIEATISRMDAKTICDRLQELVTNPSDRRLIKTMLENPKANPTELGEILGCTCEAVRLGFGRIRKKVFACKELRELLVDSNFGRSM